MRVLALDVLGGNEFVLTIPLSLSRSLQMTLIEREVDLQILLGSGPLVRHHALRICRTRTVKNLC